MPESEILLYQTENKKTKIEVRLQDDTVCLSQKQMGDLFQTTIPNVNIHIQNIFKEGELEENPTIKDYLIVQGEGSRKVTRSVSHYNLDAIISVGYRVKSHVGTKFRIWATQQLRDYLVKGFVMNDEKLKDGGSTNAHWEELLHRIRDIRTSERMFYQKVADIYTTSIDYDKNSEQTHTFFAAIQNKFHYAIHKRTASELIVERAHATRPNMGLTNWKNGPEGKIRKSDVGIAKNYFTEDELEQLGLLVEQYLSFAELQAKQKRPMYMKDWIRKFHEFLKLNERDILSGAGKISHDLAKKLAEEQFDEFEKRQRALEAQNPSTDFDKAVQKLEDQRKLKPKNLRKNDPLRVVRMGQRR